MTTRSADGRTDHRTDHRSALLWRALLPVAAVVALLADAPRGVAGGLALAGLALPLERLAGLRRLGLLDALLAWAGGLLVVLVLTGIALGSTSAGLTETGWVAALVVLGLGGLALAAVLPARTGAGPALEPDPDDPSDPWEVPGGTPRRTALGLLPWVVIAGVIAVVAVRLTTAAVEAEDVAPLAVSIGAVDGTQVEVVVSSGESTGPLEVRTSTEGGETSYPLVAVGSSGTASAIVSLPRTGRSTITVSSPGETVPLRTLVLDR